MIPNGDLGKGFGLRASLELDKHPEGQRATPCVACSIWDRGRTGCGHRQAKCQYRPETPSKAAAPAVSDVGRSGSFSVIERDGRLGAGTFDRRMVLSVPARFPDAGLKADYIVHLRI